jgi:hypothetical protein
MDPLDLFSAGTAHGDLDGAFHEGGNECTFVFG